MKRAILSWSSGKDSAFALHQILQEGSFEIVSLLTTVTDSFQRVSMHGVREELLDLQAKAVRLPLEKIRIPSPCPNEIYEQKMLESLLVWKQRGVECVIFGDLFLEDIKKYREKNLATVGMRGAFPLWMRNTKELAEQMIAEGFEAVLTCVDPKQIAKNFSGRRFDHKLLADLPASCDPCGENGEFHSFVWNGPIFTQPIFVQAGATVERDGFVFTDLVKLKSPCQKG